MFGFPSFLLTYFCRVVPENQNIFINHLPPECTDEGLQKMFQTFGPIESAKVMLDLSTGLSRGFGFVKFADIASGMCTHVITRYPHICTARQAVQFMNGESVGGKKLVVMFAESHGAKGNPLGTPSNTLFVKVCTTCGYARASCVAFTVVLCVPIVSVDTDTQQSRCDIVTQNLPVSISEEQLAGIFSAYGTVTGVNVLRDTRGTAGGLSRGQAFITYESVVSGQHAIEGLINYTFPGEEKPILLRYADTEAEKLQRM